METRGYRASMKLEVLLLLVSVSYVSLADPADSQDAEATDKGGKNTQLANVIQNVIESQNDTSDNNTETTTPVLVPKPPSSGHTNTEEAEEEHKKSLTIFFILIVVAICILMTHLLLITKFHYLPESIAVVLVGAFIGLVLKIFKLDWSKEEEFSPTIFFIVLLPPIIFESGYNLHKGNFFQNIGSILVFAIVGTAISAMVVGGGIYLLGQAKVAYEFTVVQSFAFGSLISAVDPVATLAIFHSLNVDTVLYMLVFGESILNDAVAITLTITVLEFENPAMAEVTGSAAFFRAVWRFLVMFFGSSLIGMISGLLLKFLDLRKTPSLEIGLMLVFSYLPYGLAEGLHLSGIMAILMSGIVMSHYTHHNLSPVTQITVQHTFRTIAFMAETCMFAYLGMAIFSFKLVVKPSLIIWAIVKTCVFAYIGLAFFSIKLVFQPSLIIWSIVLILLGRAVNIFPLSFISNYFREHKITKKQQFIMWFSEKKNVIVTTTLIIVLFTILFLGGSTMPLMKGDTVDSEHLSEYTESEAEVSFARPSQQTGFVRLDARYLKPFFTRRFTQQMTNLTKQWYNDVRAAPDESLSENDDDEEETLFINSSRHNSESSPQNEPLLQ
ncbi:SL9A8-like protein [Mya arenaria]|uniref:Sodium/hydrogen exchanger n=1 Tax=Mya arenaria TaxID=6604 RepID=A0ABY7EUP0_MYAAR|nr:SL9A8-like protein [Mya arenaria]